MKLAIAGKGGSGKTTIAGTLCRALAAGGAKVLAIDGDTNPNLGISIGIPRDRFSEIRPLPPGILQRMTEAQGKSRPLLTMPLEEIKLRYGTAVKPNLTLLEMGRVDHAGAG